eukprot:PhF_6_TR5601/c0_g1_i2/m.8064/K11279/NAP1L1, NRP; nucleosome assembly protein 1-like 1
MTQQPQEDYEGSLTEYVCDTINELPVNVRRRLYAIKGIAGMRETMSAYNRDLGVLQLKYSKLYTDLFRKRRAIVTGEEEVDAELVKVGEEFDVARMKRRHEDYGEEEEEGDKKRGEEDKTKAEVYVPSYGANLTKQCSEDAGASIVGVPGYWLQVLKNHPDIAETVTERDEDVLRHLIDVREEFISDTNPMDGFRLIFEFAPSVGEYFSQSLLVKTYHTKEKELDTEFLHAEGTPIVWADKEHNVTISLTKKKQRNRMVAGKTRVVIKEVPCDSFFNFFTPPCVAASGAGVMDPNTVAEQQRDSEELVAQDYEAGCCFRDDIIPHSVDWFTGFEAFNPEYEEEGDDDDEYEEIDEEEEDG